MKPYVQKQDNASVFSTNKNLDMKTITMNGRINFILCIIFVLLLLAKED